MSDPVATPQPEEFAQWIHDALNQLYDSPYLQTHPLAAALAEPGMDLLQREQHLRRTLINAIQSMRPEAGVPAQSPRWRAYQLLELRYIEGLSPAEVMQSLALSRSTYFREQARVLEALTALLWNRLAQYRPPPAPAEATPSREQLAQLEVERLSAHATWKAADVSQLIDSLHPVVEPLARSKRVSLRFDTPRHLSIMHADRVLMRQAILNVITYALDVVQDGQVAIGDFIEGNEAGIQVQAWPPTPGDLPLSATHRHGIGLEVCQRFMVAMGGTLRLESAPDYWEARLVWPLTKPRVLMVVDDNEEFIDLFRRYMAGHDWHVVGATDGATARQLMAESLPTVIAVDVMMPQEDGWEFLMALRADERTRDIPVIICSVLNEPQLAETLGAAAYLPKPITQPALLRALMPWSQAGASPPIAP